MKCKIAGREVELDIEGRVDGGFSGDMPKRENRPKLARRTDVPGPASAPPSFTFTLQGQLPSGKNSIKTTRTGRRYPTKRFEEWRDEAVGHVYRERCKVFNFVSQMRMPLFRKPTELCIEIHYASGDLRRRDIPGMMDALFHVLERAQVVEERVKRLEAQCKPAPVTPTGNLVRDGLAQVKREVDTWPPWMRD